MAKKIGNEEIERQLGLLLLMHIFFAAIALYLLVYGILNPGPFTTTVEILSGRIGRLPASALPYTFFVLGMLAVFNTGSFFSLKARKFRMIPMVTSILNCCTCIGLPLGLTTIASLSKKSVSELFS